MIVKSDAPKYSLRIPLEVKLAIEKSAKENGRSINTEMVMRLVDSLRRDSSKGNLAKS
ncbi:Arc family DNA-binding protein [Salmonella enterica subsp. enterica serovar Alachua]